MRDGERIARLEEQIRGLRDDVTDLTRELERSRKRLHDLEATSLGLVETSRLQRKQSAERDRRLELRLHALTAAVAIAGIITPLLVTITHH